MDEADRKWASGRSTERTSRLDKVLHAAFWGALILIALVAGGILTAADIFPGSQIARAYEGAKALYAKLTVYQDVYASDLWPPARWPDKGVTRHLPARAQAGVTLYTSGHEAAAFLVAMDGTVLHEWRRPFSTVWNGDAELRRPQPDPFIYFRKALAYPNGDLLVVYEGVGDTPYGYGVAKLDRDSNLIWSYFGRAHHDIDVGPDGRIYALTHAFVEEPLKGLANLASPRLDDFLVVLSPEGKELKKISLIRAVAASEYQHLLHTVSSYAVADPLHTNTVTVLDADATANFPFAEPGQVLLSFRELGAIAVLDVDREKLVWAARGPWIGQHDPDVLPNGHILLFDNYGNFRRPEGGTRVVEFDPETMAIVWQYAGSAERPFDSAIRGSQQRLANGNTLITESSGGRILEVTPEGEIAWEFVNPVRGGPQGDRIPIICWAQRLDPSRLDPSLLDPPEPTREVPPASGADHGVAQPRP